MSWWREHQHVIPINGKRSRPSNMMSFASIKNESPAST